MVMMLLAMLLLAMSMLLFVGSVNGKAYLEKVLKDTVWRNVKHVTTRKEYWFQQDGASCNVTARYL